MSEFEVYDLYDYIHVLNSSAQKKSYVMKTCLQSLKNNINELSVNFYDQWKYLDQTLYDFNRHGQFDQRPTLIFEQANKGVLGLITTTTSTFSIDPNIYSADNLSTSVNSYLNEEKPEWNVTFSISPENHVNFIFGVIPSTSPQQLYASRSVYAYVPPDLPPPLNEKPMFFNKYNINAWGINSITQKKGISGGLYESETPLTFASGIQAPEKLFVPYQSVDSETGQVTTFYASIPPQATWVEGCLAVSGGFQLGTLEKEIVVSSGGLIDIPSQETLIISASLCILIGMSLVLIYYHQNKYYKVLGLFTIVLAIISLLKQNSEDSALKEDSIKVWKQDGHLFYEPPEGDTETIKQKLINLIQTPLFMSS